MKLIVAVTDEEFIKWKKSSKLCSGDIYELLKDRFSKNEIHNILSLQIRDIEKRSEVMRVLMVNRFSRTDETLNSDIREVYEAFCHFGFSYKDIARSFFFTDYRAYEYVMYPEKIKSKLIKIKILDYMRSELHKFEVVI